MSIFLPVPGPGQTDDGRRCAVRVKVAEALGNRAPTANGLWKFAERDEMVQKLCRNGAEMVEFSNNLSQADADEAEPQDGNPEDGDGEDASEATGRTGRTG